MPRLLVISPHFPPVNAPDMQRVRMSLPHWVEAGWQVTVLTVDDPTPIAPAEPALLATVPPAVEVVRCKVWSRRWSRHLGLNNLGWRALHSIYREGSRLLSTGSFDLVYFSTTQFIVCPLGRLWQRRFGVPYVIDLQDPWVNEYYARTGTRPPGGWKYRLAHWQARLLEGWTLRRCAHVISVSPQYLTDLARRYSWFDPRGGTTLPFGAPDRDLELARARAKDSPPLLPPAATPRIAYAGRIGPDMQQPIALLFSAIAELRASGGPAWHLFFFGSSYAPAGQSAPATRELAVRFGITDLVHEQPARIGYLDSLRLLLETDVALLLGSGEAAYSPSKIYPTLLAGRPTLALAPAGSVLERQLQKLGGCQVIHFTPSGEPSASATTAVASALRAVARGETLASPPLDPDPFLQRHGAKAVADAQLALFANVIANRRAPAPSEPAT